MTEPVHIFSAGLWRLRQEVAMLTSMTPRRSVLWPGHSGAIAGWGHKPTAARARAEAQRTGLPYLAFEDGFLRSLKPGAAQRPVSMILDRSGIYYDARGPSDLETLLQDGSISDAECAAAGELVAAIQRCRLSKYNHGTDRLDAIAPAKGQKLVLIVDQTQGDESVAGGLADAASFTRMVACAVAENPGALLVAKLHPEVIAGAKIGYLPEAARHHGVQLVADDVSPWALIDHQPHVYTVSSQFGFEALLAGCKVTCFGAPFYAGWGLTDDRMPLPRRTRRRSRDDLAAAVYLRYARYFDAWRRQPIDALTAVDQLDFLRRRFLGNGRRSICLGIARWKQKAVTAMLDGPAGPPLFTRHLEQARTLAKDKAGAIAAWGVKAQALRRQLAGEAVPIVAIEDGFIRSAGLGAAFVTPLSLVFDQRGLYYDPSGPSDIEELLSSGTIAAPDVAQATKLVRRIAAERVTKYNLNGGPETFTVPPGREAVLVVGQVADDAAVIAGTAAGADAGANVNATLLASARRRHPAAYVIFKPHPDVEHLGRRGALTQDEERRGADHVARSMPIDALLPLVQQVETYASLAGFEALLRGLPVTVHGLPFYAGWGLTEDLASVPRRGVRRSVEELAAAALICYARYWDPVSGLPCPPDVVFDRIKDFRDRKPGLTVRAGKVAGQLVILWRRIAGRKRGRT